LKGGVQKMQQRNIWLPIMASVGVGAATYYNMTRNGKGMGQTMQQMVPFLSGMSGGQNAQQGNTQQDAQQTATQQNQQQYS
jgi:hypothetical protein